MLWGHVGHSYEGAVFCMNPVADDEISKLFPTIRCKYNLIY